MIDNINSDELQYILITKKIDLISHRNNILNLFSRVFNRDLLSLYWEWFYTGSPLGEPIVSLCYYKDILVGHYATIPIPLKIGGVPIKAAIGCTIMVDKKFRCFNVFYETASRVLSKLKTCNYDLIVGFPNENVVSANKVFFGFNVEYSYVAKLKGSQIKNLYSNFNPVKTICLDLDDLEYRKWRLSKPDVSYFYNHDSIFKYYQDDLELVYFGKEGIKHLDDNSFYRVIVDEQSDVSKESKLFNYYFAYKIFNTDLADFTVKKDLLMSDVF